MSEIVSETGYSFNELGLVSNLGEINKSIRQIANAIEEIDTKMKAITDGEWMGMQKDTIIPHFEKQNAIYLGSARSMAAFGQQINSAIEIYNNADKNIGNLISEIDKVTVPPVVPVTPPTTGDDKPTDPTATPSPDAASTVPEKTFFEQAKEDLENAWNTLTDEEKSCQAGKDFRVALDGIAKQVESGVIKGADDLKNALEPVVVGAGDLFKGIGNFFTGLFS